MTKETLVQALQAEGLKVANDSVSIPESRDASFMVAGPGETVQVAKVTKVELRESAICLETAKSNATGLRTTSSSAFASAAPRPRRNAKSEPALAADNRSDQRARER